MEAGDIVIIEPRLDAGTTYLKYKGTVATVTRALSDNLFRVDANGIGWYPDELVPVTTQQIRKPVGGI